MTKIVSAFAVAACAGVAMADSPVLSGVASGVAFNTPRSVLVNQANTSGVGIVDQNFSDFPDFSTGMVDDFSTGGAAWNINKVTMYFTKGFGFWNGGITTGTLSFFPKSGAFPGAGDAPGNLGNVGVSLVDGGSYWAVVADTSGVAALQNINGSYWIGLTPNAAFASFGQEFHLLSSDPINGDASRARNPGGGFGAGTNWVDAGGIGLVAPADMNMTLEGEVVPAPGAFALMGLGGLAAGRRRR